MENIPFLILFADIGLIINVGIIKPYTLQPYEFFILLATLFLIVGFLFKKAPKDFFSVTKKYIQWFLVMIFFIITGIVFALGRYGFSRNIIIPILTDFFLLGTAFLGFIAHIYYGKNTDFRKRVLYALSITPILFIPVIIFPSLASHFRLLGNNNSFLGFFSNQNILGSFLLIPFTIYINQYILATTWHKRAIFLLLIIFTLTLSFWTGSRASWISSVVIASIFSWYHIKNYDSRRKKIISFTLTAMLYIFCAFTALLLVPRNAISGAVGRIYQPQKLSSQQIIKDSSSQQGISPENNLEIIDTMKDRTPSVLAYQNRQNIWPKAAILFIKNPGGLGLEYARMSEALTETDGRWVPAHNSLLEIALIGGIGLLILFLAGTVWFLRKLFALPQDHEKITYIAILFGLFIMMFFNDFLYTLPWVWIIIGLAIAKIESSTVELLPFQNQ